jgi:hypothetical protein
MKISEGLMWLVFAHFIADWVFQTDMMANYKAKFWQIMYVHCIVYTAICVLALRLILPEIEDKIILVALYIWGSHAVIDRWKCHCGATKENFPTWHLYVDQGLHIGILWQVYLGFLAYK